MKKKSDTCFLEKMVYFYITAPRIVFRGDPKLNLKHYDL